MSARSRLARSPWLVTFAVAVAARIAAQILLGFYENPAGTEHAEIALNLVTGRGFTYEHLGTQYRALAATLYALLLGGVYWLFGASGVSAGLFQALLGGLLAITVQALARPLGAVVALLAGLGTALHPGLLVYAARVSSLTFDATLVALVALQIVRLTTHSGWRYSLWLASTCAAIMLERSVLLAGVAAALAVLAGTAARGMAGRAAALCALAVALAAAPMFVRNKMILGEWLLSPTAGEILWRGNNPRAAGGGRTAEGTSIVDASPELRAAVWGRPAVEQNRMFQRAAWAFVKEHPAAAGIGVLRKMMYFWTFSPAQGAEYPRRWLTSYLVSYAAMVLLAVHGAMQALRGGHRLYVTLLVSLSIAISFGQAVFYVDGRHRWQVEPLLLILAAYGAVSLADRWRRRHDPVIVMTAIGEPSA